MRREIAHIHRRHEPRRVGEEVVHLLERPLFGLGLGGPEPNRVGEIAHHEQDVEAPADFLHGDRGHLADHGVEGEGDHDADGDTLAAGAGVEYFGGDDPCFGFVNGLGWDGWG
jgi:hypothetical protein